MVLSELEMKDLFDDIEKQVIEWRRHLHQHPELSFQEKETAQFIYDQLVSFGDLKISRPTETSVMARLVGDRPGKVLAIRADMDALPIQEESGVAYASKVPGVMHACGHDGHTSMLLGTASMLTKMKDKLKGEVVFIFQHAEEQAQGALDVMASGALDDVDMIIGGHLYNDIPVGEIGIFYGPMMAASDGFEIEITGKGGHGAQPHQTTDPILIGTEIVQSLQRVVSRQTDPLESLVLSVTKFQAGSALNVIPDNVSLGGTTRALKEDVRNFALEQVEKVAKNIANIYDADCDVKIIRGCDAVINDDQIAKVMERTTREVLGDQAVFHDKPKMISEDFSFYIRQLPGCFVFIGSGNKELNIGHPLHHPSFNIDESALINGVKLYVGAAINILLDEGIQHG